MFHNSAAIQIYKSLKSVHNNHKGLQNLENEIKVDKNNNNNNNHNNHNIKSKDNAFTIEAKQRPKTCYEQFKFNNYNNNNRMTPINMNFTTKKREEIQFSNIIVSKQNRFSKIVGETLRNLLKSEEEKSIREEVCKMRKIPSKVILNRIL